MNTYSITLLTVTALLKQSVNAQNAAMYCEQDGYYNYANDFDGDQNTIKTDYFFNGMVSYHSNQQEDRRFKFRYCKTFPTSMGWFTGAKSMQLTDTGYDEEWYRTCDGYNGGHAAIHGIVSWHNNWKEDRQFRIYCGLLDVTKHRLGSCSTTDILNSYDGTVIYYCENNGVIRSIWSRHSDRHEDRVWKFECCNILDLVYSFSNIIGKWEGRSSCLGCPQHQYTEQFGTESSITTSIESTYSNELSATVSAGFEFETVFSASTSVTGTKSQSIARSLAFAFSRSYSESTTFICDKTYLYQWVIRGNEQRSDGSRGAFRTHSNNYLCTNQPDPKCPPGYCSNNDCQTCMG